MNKKKKKMIDYGRYGYFFIAPFFITYLVFQLWPLINTFYYSTLSYYKRGTHPNDLGFDRMVEQYQPQIMRILKKYGIK